MEVDCHGKTWAEALAEFIARYNGALQAGSGIRWTLYTGTALPAPAGRYGRVCGLFWAAIPTVWSGSRANRLTATRGIPGAARAAAARSRRPAGGAGLGVLRPAAGGQQNHGKFRRHGDDRHWKPSALWNGKGGCVPLTGGRVKTYQAI